MILVHVTSESNLDSILREGLRGPSCWSTDEKIVAAYTVAQQMHHGKTPAWLMTSLEFFKESELYPDMPSIYEPISAAIDLTEDEVLEAWSKVINGDWKDSLKIVKSLVIGVNIPPKFLHVMESPKAMIEQLQRQKFEDI